MTIIYFLSLLTFSSSIYAQSLICNLTENKKAPLIKITYEENIPRLIYLKRLEEKSFRKQNVSIKTVFERNDNNFESFSVLPNFDESKIDWEQEPNCYKSIGTQWYFSFYYGDNYSVIFTPYYIKESDSCITPRVTPSQNNLNCVLED